MYSGSYAVCVFILSLQFGFSKVICKLKANQQAKEIPRRVILTSFCHKFLNWLKIKSEKNFILSSTLLQFEKSDNVYIYPLSVNMFCL